MTSEHRPLPYGGDQAMARSIQGAHQPTANGCCRCGERWRCREHRDSTLVYPIQLGAPRQDEPTAVDCAAAVVIVLGLLSIGGILGYLVVS
ncbi:MAG: hypothetical protein ACRDT6_14600 [Micromonosporaceae bacterium]